VLEKILVGICGVVIGDGERLDLRRQTFEGLEIGPPKSRTDYLGCYRVHGYAVPIGAIPNRE
jgi:hypothetical protein